MVSVAEALNAPASRDQKNAASYFGFERLPHHNPWLDFLRAIAIFLVLLRHGQRALVDALGKPAGYMGNFMTNGWVGVDLFLVLSGFLIAGSLLRLRDSGPSGSMRSYFLNRGLRILPAYFVVLFLVVAGAFPSYSISAERLGWRTLYHLLILQDYLPSDINVVFWSLGVEEKFYLLAPLLLGFFASRRTSTDLVIGLGVLIAVSPLLRIVTYLVARPADYAEFWPILRSPFHAVMEPLLVGMGIAVLSRRGVLGSPSPETSSRLLAASLGLTALVLFSHDMMASIGWTDVVIQPLFLAGTFGVAVFAATNMKHKNLLFEYAFRVSARLSYALYLVHFPLIPISLRLSDGAELGFWTVYLVLSTLVALALHFVVEKPFLKLRRQLNQTRLTPVQETV